MVVVVHVFPLVGGGGGASTYCRAAISQQVCCMWLSWSHQGYYSVRTIPFNELHVLKQAAGFHSNELDKVVVFCVCVYDSITSEYYFRVGSGPPWNEY